MLQNHGKILSPPADTDARFVLHVAAPRAGRIEFGQLGRDVQRLVVSLHGQPHVFTDTMLPHFGDQLHAVLHLFAVDVRDHVLDLEPDLLGGAVGHHLRDFRPAVAVAQHHAQNTPGRGDLAPWNAHHADGQGVVFGARCNDPLAYFVFLRLPLDRRQSARLDFEHGQIEDGIDSDHSGFEFFLIADLADDLAF